ncbi:hypothetical protein HZC08_01535, partial [Candidatus Micrarchaeota archaeon]|nr:hypothetical protein [Candidatus Micrarchaeota archaeon]
MGYLENLNTKLLLFHQSVEKFFEERKKEATLVRAAISIIIPFVLFPLLMYGSAIFLSEEIKDIAVKRPAYFISSAGGDILLYFVLILAVVASYMLVSKALYKIKINW